MDHRGIDYLGFDRVIKRGTGVVIEEDDNSLLLFDTISEAHFLACDQPDKGISILDRHRDRNINLLMTTNCDTAKIAFDRYGFSQKLECYQTAFFGDPPEEEFELSIKIADMGDFPMLAANYDLISPEEMKKVIARGSLLLGYKDDQLAGFIGEHLEGSIGMLYIFPEYRRMGYASMLEKYYFMKMIREGFTPFCQVEKDNTDSLNLQKKLGMTISENLICWMWK